MISPKADETQSAFINRALSDVELMAKHPDVEVRTSVAHAFWRNFKRTGHIHGSRAEFAVLRGAEILAVGTWNGREFTLSHLEGIVASFDALSLSGRIPLKIGHTGDDVRFDDGAPALGWVDRVWIEGDKLMADFKDMPRVVYDAIQQGLYKFVSVELLRNVQADTRVIPWVLDAVALLGATAPAVGILKDLTSLTLARSSGLQCEGRVTFRREDGTKPTPSTGGISKMTEAEIAELQRKLKASEDRAEAAEKQAKDAQDAQLALAKQQKAEKVDARRKAITKLFNDAVGLKRIEPNVREQFASLTQYEADEAACERVTDEQVMAYIDMVGKPATKGGKSNLSRGSERSGGTGDSDANRDEDYSQMTPPEEVNARAVALCRQRNQDPTQYDVLLSATGEVLRTNPELAEKYKYDATDRFGRQSAH